METLAVFHILKNGGTTLVDRYRLNHSFVYQRVYNEVVYNYKQSNQMRSKVSNLKDHDVRMIFGHGVNFGLSYVLQNNINYVILRYFNVVGAEKKLRCGFETKKNKK